MPDGVGLSPGAQLRENDDGRFEPLGAVDVHEAHGVRLEGSDAHFLEIEGGSVLGETLDDVAEREAVSREPAREREDLEEVAARGRALGSRREARDGAEPLHDEPDRRPGAVRAHVPPGIGEETHSAHDAGVSARRRIPEVRKAPPGVPPRVEGVVVHPAERTREERNDGDGVVGVLDRGEERPDLLQPARDRERAAARDVHGHAEGFEGARVRVDVLARPGQDEEVPEARPAFGALRRDGPARVHRPAHEARDVLRVSLRGGEQPERARGRAGILSHGVERRETGLTLVRGGREEAAEDVVRGPREGRDGAEVRRERERHGRPRP